MNSSQVKNLVSKVPTISRSVPLKSFNVSLRRCLTDKAMSLYRRTKAQTCVFSSQDLSLCLSLRLPTPTVVYLS